ncbi:hypothetical protein H312_03196 [Anncaliia algerae PRA339]|uniref:Uncharacterized protein n=1 Tax=Anncaliia algerae PRA339 TaxID=1288291 RepID=A0A059EXF6_9MICR|nr:hypothetical protein H312_03196 [Anncaliia algerae PRA339]
MINKPIIAMKDNSINSDINNAINEKENNKGINTLDTLMNKYSPEISIKIADQLYSSVSRSEKKLLLDWITKLAKELGSNFKPWIIKNDYVRSIMLKRNFIYSDELVKYIAYSNSISSIQSILAHKDKFKNKEIISNWISNPEINKINKQALLEIYEYIKEIE